MMMGVGSFERVTFIVRSGWRALGCSMHAEWCQQLLTIMRLHKSHFIPVLFIATLAKLSTLDNKDYMILKACRKNERMECSQQQQQQQQRQQSEIEKKVHNFEIRTHHKFSIRCGSECKKKGSDCCCCCCVLGKEK